MPTDMALAALAVARKAPVFLCWGIKDGACCCRAGAHCDRPGKHPHGGLAPRGYKDATRDPARLRHCWAVQPLGNPAIPTGRASGLIVVDTLPGERPDLPRTFRVQTGNAEHWYYRAPEDPVASRSVKADGIDCIKADNAYVLVPPSRHVNGNVYRKLGGRLVPYPSDLVPAAPAQARAVDGVVPSGMRNTWLYSLAASLRAHGVRHRALEAALLAINADQCEPPEKRMAVKRTAASAAKGEAIRGARLDFVCPLCQGAAAATFKRYRDGTGWRITCWDGCARRGYLPALAQALDLDRSATKEDIVVCLGERNGLLPVHQAREASGGQGVS